MQFSCTARISLVSRLVLRWACLPFTLAGAASLIALQFLLTLLILLLRNRKPQASLQAFDSWATHANDFNYPPAPPGNLLDDDDTPANQLTGNTWLDYLDDPCVQICCRHHLSRCLELDPGRYRHD